MDSEKKMKILAIHGYRQSDKIFYSKLGSIRKRFKKEVEFTFIKAPHYVPNLEKSKDEQKIISILEETNEYGWWFNAQNKTFNATDPSNLCIGFDESLLLIYETFNVHGPFDGLMGFSQGASFVSILCAMQEQKIFPFEFSFAIIISGFKSLCKSHEIFYNQKIKLPTLHIYGESDKIILNEISEELSNYFLNKDIIIHEGGHYVPGNKSIYYNFIKKMALSKLTSFTSTQIQ